MAIVYGPGDIANYGPLSEEYSRMTVREIISTTTGLGLPQLVAMRAAIQLLTLVDARGFCRTEAVPPGGGTTYHFQKLITLVPSASGEPTPTADPTAITGQDDTLSDVTALLVMFRKRTFIGDMAQRQAAVNVADVVGISHGNAMNREMNNDIYTVLDGNTTNTVGIGALGVSANYALADIFTLRGQIEAQRGRPDTFVSYPFGAAAGGGTTSGWYPFVSTNVTSVQFTAALADYLRSGSIAEFFGLKLYIDDLYKPASFTAAGSEYCHALVGNEAEGWAQAEDVVSEIQRAASKVGFDLVTHSIGKSALVLEEHIASVQHT